MIFEILATPLLIYRVFFKKWADFQEKKFQIQNDRSKKNGLKVHFYPELPSKRASVRNALVYLGYEITKGWNTKSVNFAWHDETIKVFDGSNGKVINFNCTNISKSFLDKVHSKVFGYGLSVDPNSAKGRILEKSELNGKHDAQIVNAPCNCKEGYVYQKLIDTRKGLFYEDIRPVVIGDEIPMVYLNYRLAGKRFSAKKIRACLAKTQDYLTQKEQSQILQLCTLMGVDLAELDVLRDNKDGKIYVVDVNPTAFGPAHGLSTKNKLRAIEIYGASLKKLLAGF